MIFMPEEDNKESKVEVQPSSLSEAQAEAAAAHAEYEAAKEAAEQAKPDDGTLRPTTISDAVAASEAAAEAEVAYKAAEGKLKAHFSCLTLLSPFNQKPISFTLIFLLHTTQIPSYFIVIFIQLILSSSSLFL